MHFHGTLCILHWIYLLLLWTNLSLCGPLANCYCIFCDDSLCISYENWYNTLGKCFVWMLDRIPGFCNCFDLRLQQSCDYDFLFDWSNFGYHLCCLRHLTYYWPKEIPPHKRRLYRRSHDAVRRLCHDFRLPSLITRHGLNSESNPINKLTEN